MLITWTTALVRKFEFFATCLHKKITHFIRKCTLLQLSKRTTNLDSKLAYLELFATLLKSFVYCKQQSPLVLILLLKSNQFQRRTIPPLLSYVINICLYLTKRPHFFGSRFYKTINIYILGDARSINSICNFKTPVFSLYVHLQKCPL